MKKILIVEDDQLVANIYRNKFSVEGYQVEVAPDGERGVQLAQRFRPDAVVLDLMLPKVTGIELMKQLRAQPAFATLPLIVFTNTYLSNLLEEAWRAGATKCLSKSHCTPKQLIELIRNQLEPPTPRSPEPHSAETTKLANEGVTASVAAQVNSPIPMPEVPAFQAELRSSFVESVPGTLAIMRGLLQAMIKAELEPIRLNSIRELYGRVHTVGSQAAVTGLTQIAHLADALEALLRELHDSPKNINASTLRTVASALDLLGVLLDRPQPQAQAWGPVKIVVVDDEAISRRAVTFALEKARLSAISLEDPEAAYAVLSKGPFDLIFLDVDMPGMNGFELCTKIRALPTHKKTPVVFVTSLNDFESRANSMMSGGSDFIAKPFLFIEVAVKALVHVFRGRLVSADTPSPATPTTIAPRLAGATA